MRSNGVEEVFICEEEATICVCRTETIRFTPLA